MFSYTKGSLLLERFSQHLSSIQHEKAACGFGSHLQAEMFTPSSEEIITEYCTIAGRQQSFAAGPWNHQQYVEAAVERQTAPSKAKSSSTAFQIAPVKQHLDFDSPTSYIKPMLQTTRKHTDVWRKLPQLFSVCLDGPAGKDSKLPKIWLLLPSPSTDRRRQKTHTSILSHPAPKIPSSEMFFLQQDQCNVFPKVIAPWATSCQRPTLFSPLPNGRLPRTVCHIMRNDDLTSSVVSAHSNTSSSSGASHHCQMIFYSSLKIIKQDNLFGEGERQCGYECLR